MPVVQLGSNNVKYMGNYRCSEGAHRPPTPTPWGYVTQPHPLSHFIVVPPFKKVVYICTNAM